MEAMYKFVRKSNDLIFWKLNKFKILGLFSIIHVTMAMTPFFSGFKQKTSLRPGSVVKEKGKNLGETTKKQTNKQIKNNW